MQAIRTFVSVLIVMLPSVGGVSAQEMGEWIAHFEEWSVSQYSEGGRSVCYMSSTPLDMEPKNVRRGLVYVEVAHDTGDGSRDVVSVIAGYTFAEGRAVVAVVDDQEFRMFTKVDRAWNGTTDQDASMVQAMISGSRLTVLGYSNRGTETRDVYSLLGFTAAHEFITEACGG